MSKILVVDDEPNIVEVLRLYLEHAGYDSVLLHRGRGVVEAVRREAPELVLLDIMLPDASGFELCQSIRSLDGEAGQVPIIFLTAKGESIDKLRGFTLGVDDYIVKPFDPNELIARIRAVLRRVQLGGLKAAEKRESGAGGKKKTLQIRNLWVDLEQYRVAVDGRKVELTPKEIELLYFLASNPSRVYTREDLLGYVWDFDFSGGTRTVDAHVKNLRKKLGPQSEWTIQTLWGVGYAFEVAKPH